MQNYSNFWNQVLDKLEFEFDSDTFNEVFRPCNVHEFLNGYIYVVGDRQEGRCAAVHRVTKSWMRLSNWTELN